VGGGGGTDELWSSVRPTPGALVLRGVVLAALIGGSVAFASFDKTVTVSVDGDTQEVRSFARTVDDVLDSADIAYSSKDDVVPAPDESVSEGDKVTVRYARLLKLTLDGEQREVWVTARNVDEALRQLGVRADGAFLSVSRDSSIPRAGIALEVRLAKSVMIVADGGQRPFTTTAVTVNDALGEAGIALGAADTVAPAASERLVDGATVTITRIRTEREERTVELPYETTRNDDATLASGTERITQRGRVGLKTQVFDVIYANGERSGETLVSEETTREPVPQVVAVGTGPAAATGGGSGGAVPTTSDGLNWAALAECESGGNPRAVSSSGRYHGLYQFSVATWQSVGGTGLPSEASPEEQTYRAQVLLERSGVGQWPTCGPRLYT
jgi:resuscitation-promoting factor RpfB